MDIVTIEKLLTYVKGKQPQLEYEESLFNILEGDVLLYLEIALKEQLNDKARKEALQRSSPINVLKKIIDKLSKIYSKGVIRKTSNPSDQELLDEYSKRVNEFFQEANANFNTYKRCGIEIYYDEEEEQLNFRTIPAHLYMPYSSNKVNPLRMTDLLKIYDGSIQIINNEEVVEVSHDDKNITVKSTIPNEYGVIPFSYISRSMYLLFPKSDTDLKQMSILFPTLLTDINFSVKYQTNPIVYGVDVDSSNLERNPNVFWSFRTIEEGKTPSIGSISPQADINGILNNITQQMSFWLETKNIKADAIGIGTDQSSSGLALLIRNIDTTEDRNQQIVYFKKLEKDFWERLKIIHNYIADTGNLKNGDRRKFSEEFEVVTIYPEQKPIEDRKEKVARLKEEINAGLTTRKRAIKELYEDFGDEEIDELIAEIDREFINVREESTDNKNNDEDGDNGEMAKRENRPA